MALRLSDWQRVLSNYIMGLFWGRFRFNSFIRELSDSETSMTKTMRSVSNTEYCSSVTQRYFGGKT